MKNVYRITVKGHVINTFEVDADSYWMIGETVTFYKDTSGRIWSDKDAIASYSGVVSVELLESNSCE